MTPIPSQAETAGPAVETHLLGQVDFDSAVTLQDRLVDEVADRDDGQIKLLFCEHPAIITIGRDGSPAEVRYEVDLVRRRQIEVRWVKRGGGSFVHMPGQLAVYPIVPLRWHGMTPGSYHDRFRAGIAEGLDELGFPTDYRPELPGLWGRTGRLVAFGVAVRRWVTYHGAYINVSPTPGLSHLVESSGADGLTAIGSLVAERRGRIGMQAVRATLVRRLSEAFGCDRWHMHTSHPLLRRI